jgi:hypothetical protein
MPIVCVRSRLRVQVPSFRPRIDAGSRARAGTAGSRAPRTSRTAGVSLDDEDTWADVEPFLKRQGPSLTPVRGDANASIVDSYDPDRSFPVLVVIDARGRIAFARHGAREHDEIIAAIEHARACDG